MNSKIFNLIQKNLQVSFNLTKYRQIYDNINEKTLINQLPWTPARYKKFKDSIENELQLSCDFIGTVEDIVNELDQKYLKRFFGEIWKPRTDDYKHTGWQLVEEINKLNPKSVLDVGCGYNPFKGRIDNLIGIDPYNDCADYMIDILDYKVKHNSYDVLICLGSINFNSKEDVEKRFSHCVSLLAKGGKMFFRANPGIQWKNGPYVEIFAWSFDIVKEFEEKYNLKLEQFKQEFTNPGRLYFVYSKL